MFLIAAAFVAAIPACDSKQEQEQIIFLITVEGGTSDPADEARVGDNVTLTPDEPEEGYKFKEWVVVSGNVNIVDNMFTMPARDVVIRAEFTPKSIYSITVEGGTSDPADEATEGDEVTLTPNAPEEGDEFKDWEVISENVEIVDNKFIMPSENVVIRAVFGKVNEADKITDPVFKIYCEQFDANGDGILSKAECEAVTNIRVNSMNIESLDGIELFTGLTQLICSGNILTSLDVSKNTALDKLYCFLNPITELDVSNNTALTLLYCQNTAISELDLSNNTALKSLSCGDTPNLNTLNVGSCIGLESLHCTYSHLPALDISNNTALRSLICFGGNLSVLDISNNTALEELLCGLQSAYLRLLIAPSQAEWWAAMGNRSENVGVNAVIQ